MNQRYRVMLTYALLIGVLLFPLSYYSQPATVASGNEPAGAGGRLARLREQFKLSQADLGEIDPAGETIKLATLGMRCVAAAMLWHEANEAKKKEDWTGTWTKLDQLAKLEPNYINVWRFQAWNVSYNIAVEFDDYRDRYFWIKEGIKYLQKGSRYNVEEHRLISDIGTDTGRKIGVADEKLEYRQLFHVDIDPEFPDHDDSQHGYLKPRTQEQRDNWLVGKEYYEKAIDIWDNRNAEDKIRLATMNPFLLYSEPAKAQINYADGLEQDGRFGDIAREAWSRALEMWNLFGLRDIASGRGMSIRLGDQEQLEAEAQQLRAELESLDPGLRERLVEEKKAKLTEEERKLITAGPGEVAQEDQQKAYAAYMKIQVNHKEVADRIKGDQSARAQEVVLQLAAKEDEDARWKSRSRIWSKTAARAGCAFISPKSPRMNVCWRFWCAGPTVPPFSSPSARRRPSPANRMPPGASPARSQIRQLPSGSVQISRFDFDGAQPRPFRVLMLHDLSFVDRRQRTARDFVLAFVGISILLLALLIVLVAWLQLRRWVQVLLGDIRGSDFWTTRSRRGIRCRSCRRCARCWPRPRSSSGSRSTTARTGRRRRCSRWCATS